MPKLLWLIPLVLIFILSGCTQSNSIVESTEPEPTPSPTQVVTEVKSGWELYRNENLDFEVQHPEDWGVQVVDDKTGVEDSDGRRVILWSRKDYEEYMPPVWEGPLPGMYSVTISRLEGDCESYANSPEIEVVATEPIVIDELTGTKDVFSGPYAGWAQVCLQGNGVNYQINLPVGDPDQEDIANQILETFRFVD
ncbi:hypothetical protein ACFL0Z_01520 [Patescibacteria group bacterium]